MSEQNLEGRPSSASGPSPVTIKGITRNTTNLEKLRKYHTHLTGAARIDEGKQEKPYLFPVLMSKSEGTS